MSHSSCLLLCFLLRSASAARFMPRTSRNSELDSGAHDHGSVAWELEVVGGVGGDVGGREEEALAPAAHPRVVAAVEFDLGEEVGDLALVERAFDAGLVDERDQGGDVLVVAVAVAGRDVGDAVVFVAEVVEDETLRGRDVWDGSGLEREDDDVFLEDVVVLDVGAHRERAGCLAAVEEDGGAGASLEGWLHRVEVLDERAERSFFALAEAGDKQASALPGGEDGENDEADEQRQPRTVDELGQ